jgi:hypothetical protein
MKSGRFVVAFPDTLAAANRFDPDTNSWTALTAPAITSNSNNRLVAGRSETEMLIMDGNTLATSPTGSRAMVKFNPSTGATTAAASSPAGFYLPVSALWHPQRGEYVIFASKYTTNYDIRWFVYRYNPTTNTWTAALDQTGKTNAPVYGTSGSPSHPIYDPLYPGDRIDFLNYPGYGYNIATDTWEARPDFEETYNPDSSYGSPFSSNSMQGSGAIEVGNFTFPLGVSTSIEYGAFFERNQHLAWQPLFTPSVAELVTVSGPGMVTNRATGDTGKSVYAAAGEPVHPCFPEGIGDQKLRRIKVLRQAV